MRKWKIEIKATNEEQALFFLQKLCEAFEAAVKDHGPLEEYTITGEKDYIVCKRDHSIFMNHG